MSKRDAWVYLMLKVQLRLYGKVAVLKVFHIFNTYCSPSGLLQVVTYIGHHKNGSIKSVAMTHKFVGSKLIE